MGRVPKRKSAPKRVLRLLGLEHSKRTLLSTLGSPNSKKRYEFAIDHFVAWYCSEPRLAFSKTVVLRYRLELEARRPGPATINLRLARSVGSPLRLPIPASLAPNSPPASRA